jgi:site-specific recombinase XerD
MYEHLRNDFLSKLMLNYKGEDVNFIGSLLDKVASDYDITEKTTALAVIESEPKLIRLYLASKKLEGISDNTLNLYSNRLRIFFETVYKQPQDIQTNDIRMFLVQYQMQTKVSDRTLDKIRQILNCFFEWCKNEEYISKNPCKNIKEIKYEVEPRHSLTRYQLEQVRRLCKTKRDLAIVDMLYSTGCRVTELINIKFSDIDTTDNSIQIIGKGRKHNTVYLNDTALISLQDYIDTERKGESEYLFVSHYSPYNQITSRTVQHMFKNMCVDFKLTPHIIRHTSATLALQSGMSITQVQKMLGHSSVNTTQIYAETSQEEIALAHKRYVI